MMTFCSTLAETSWCYAVCQGFVRPDSSPTNKSISNILTLTRYYLEKYLWWCRQTLQSVLICLQIPAEYNIYLAKSQQRELQLVVNQQAKACEAYLKVWCQPRKSILPKHSSSVATYKAWLSFLERVCLVKLIGVRMALYRALHKIWNEAACNPRTSGTSYLQNSQASPCLAPLVTSYLVDGILTVVLACGFQKAWQLEEPECFGKEAGIPQQLKKAWVCNRDGRRWHKAWIGKTSSLSHAQEVAGVQGTRYALTPQYLHFCIFNKNMLACDCSRPMPNWCKGCTFPHQISIHAGRNLLQLQKTKGRHDWDCICR